VRHSRPTPPPLHAQVPRRAAVGEPRGASLRAAVYKVSYLAHSGCVALSSRRLPQVVRRPGTGVVFCVRPARARRAARWRS
jgi:hypothetical protein